MSTQTLVKSAPEVSTFQIWDEPTPLAQVNDYIRQAFAPIMQVVEKETLPNGRIWLLVKPESGFYTEEWLLEQKPAEFLEEPQPAPTETGNLAAGMAGDCVSVKLRPQVATVANYEQGYAHGQRDAAERLHLMYAVSSCDYSKGYLKGYNAVLNSTQPFQQPSATKQIDWSVKSDPCNPGLYQVWIGDCCLLEKAISYSEGERIAQRYVATDKLIKRQNATVLAAYAG